ncbi:integrase catalytic domain-containing protein [Trichonephila inaurata madagascariensis]|uniref:Integrase catalytic domain-containing protein n=1 Tax=Trichonephila inaurata madagascariensis TaxID=2747483 RepID=A0A8X6X5N2_9ARAC|nr:integrase catalytic domain-containing protein [Trichonephila inaurata madagascariensis]
MTRRYTKNCQKKVENLEPLLSFDEVEASTSLIQAEGFPETGDYKWSIDRARSEKTVINCRLLTYISHESEDLLPFTPSMFLQDIRVSGTAGLDMLDGNKLLVRQCFSQELRKQMRSHFPREYLGQFIQRHGQKDCELKVE